MTDEVALWKQRIAERKSNGQTIAHWCQDQNVTKGTYHYWRKQIKRAEAPVEETVLPQPQPIMLKALGYSQNQRNYLETFMADGRIPLSNNLCEANIKPYATARRSWLFADTPKGARANAILYTLVESARANELDVYEYLKYLLTEMPNNSHLEHPEIIDRYLPWSKDLPEECRLNHEYIKRFKK